MNNFTKDMVPQPIESTIMSLDNFAIFSIPIIVLAAYYAYSKKQSDLKSSSNGKLTLSEKKTHPILTDYKASERPFGFWKPDYNFKYPKVAPYPGFDLKTTKPIPYRAFKHKYFVTMGIRGMESDSWIELDNEWEYFHNLKLKRIEERGDKAWHLNALTVTAAWEILEELCNYLPQRYPSMFKYENRIMEILSTGEKFNLNDSSLNPILSAAKLIQDDIIIMVEKEDGAYYLEGGCSTLAGFWRLREKVGLKLDDIHVTSGVPQYEKQLKTGMNKLFRRIEVDSPVVRNNYFIQTDGRLDWSHSIGDEDDGEIGWRIAKEATDINEVYFRSERQSLRRLPISGALCFTVRTYFIPIVKLVEEDYVPKRLLDGLLSWTPDIREYKGFHTFEKVLIPFLEQKAKEQEERGLDYSKEPTNWPF
ncbi:conserved hypothetical protein [Candida tropicalis MYA-3404]|uniref:HRQ family protein 1 n=1 Tax=Candida tropicalis (strain ATCC MYA-3404 / T1) TaxID=294747 RepID=C5MF88_CANTT|nr:conserved hypothetical protein [Candida tropicalis MYA-3404]EER31948.1 conserved hypothetical protein [Candida tropicalis MYA-3404]KAG4405536.1 hypothetical protein JTP64_005572 [Candida tropicalis]MCP8718783.1 DUF3445 domain-containing protein [Asgard group archaeon]